MRPRIGPFRPRRFDRTLATTLGPAERSAGQATAPAAVLALDPELYPPAGSRAVIVTDQQNSVAAGAMLLPACSFVVERGRVFVLRQLTIFADAPALGTRATWAVLINGVVAPGLGAVTMLFRAAGSLATSLDTLRLVVPELARVDVQVTNLDGIPRVYGAQLVGWNMPRATLGGGPANA